MIIFSALHGHKVKIVFIYISKLLLRIDNGTLTSNIHHCCQHFDKQFLHVKFKIKENNKRLQIYSTIVCSKQTITRNNLYVYYKN